MEKNYVTPEDLNNKCDTPLRKFAFVRLDNDEWDPDPSNESLGIGYLTSILREEGIETKIFEKSGLVNNTLSYLPVEYNFNNPKVGLFEKSLRDAFPIYFPLLKYFFEKRRYGEVTEQLEKELNEVSFSFFDYNLKLKNNWSVEKFGESLDEFTSDLKRLAGY